MRAQFPIRSKRLHTEKKIVKLMGCRFELSAIHPKAALARKAIQAGINEMKRIERLISSWDPNSQTSEINRMAGIRSVAVDQELYELIRRSLKISSLTEGAFDISFGAGKKLWSFNGQEGNMPSPEVVARSVERIDYRKIDLDPVMGSVYLRKKGMRIGFGGIGKGYAANRAKMVMKEMGIQSGLVNASGDLICWGKQANGKDWSIGIAHPQQGRPPIAQISLKEGALVTSGDYEQYMMINGLRYSHIIDPRTGYPTTGIKSVSLICPDPELGDALATSVSVMGIRAGLHMINQLHGIECLIITDQDELISSQGLEIQKV